MLRSSMAIPTIPPHGPNTTGELGLTRCCYSNTNSSIKLASSTRSESSSSFEKFPVVPSLYLGPIL